MNKIKKNIILFLTFLLTASYMLPGSMSMTIDNDPLTDLSITIDILKIRSLEHNDPQLYFREIIDSDSDPDYYIKILIESNDETIIFNEIFQSDITWNTKYLYNTPFSVTVDIPDELEDVGIVIQLWDAADEGSSEDRLCDISPDVGDSDDAKDVEILYDVKTGHWSGDDALQDPSGYGRLNGCDDGTIYSADCDSELWFSITQNDYDHDSIPYYMETSVYGTDPMVDDGDDDIDGDGIPTWWEWKYGFDPTVWDDHSESDPDNDGLPHINEYKTSQWFSDPFTRDLFIELDQMCEGPGCAESRFPDGAKELLYTAHDRQNVIYHLDDGSWEGETGSEFIPFDEETEWGELQKIYKDHFLHGDEDNWRREIFHYGVVIYKSNWVEGNAFGSNRFQISASLLEKKVEEHGFDRDVTYASAFMHETGHTLAFWPIPGHNEYGWLLRLFLPLYKSCMSYGWIYRMVDYSDGSRPCLGPQIGDYDDWERMDLTNFLRDGWQ